MGYRIEYDHGSSKYEIKEDKSFPYFAFLLGLIAVCVLALQFAPEGFTQLRALLIPGEDAVTVEAFQTMTDDLRSGATLSDALESFCRYVIHGK